MSGDGFKMRPIGPMTPEVLLAQAAEMKWKGIMVIGFLEGEEQNGRVTTAFNMAGLTPGEFQTLARKIEAIALEGVKDEFVGTIKP